MVMVVMTMKTMMVAMTSAQMDSLGNGSFDMQKLRYAF